MIIFSWYFMYIVQSLYNFEKVYFIGKEENNSIIL